MRRRVKFPIIGVIALLAIAVMIVVLITNSDWGRERVRRQVLAVLQNQVNGVVRIGNVDGNLLGGVRIASVAISDSAGNPFLTADTLQARYSLRALLGQRIALDGLRLVHPLVVLDQRTGEDWNFVKLFARDSVPADTTSAPGWGDWIRITDAEIVDGRVLVRVPWTPNATLTGAARDSAIAAALSADSRSYIERVEGGFQTVYDFRELTAEFPLVRVADPGFSSRRVEIASLRTEGYPFRPPAMDITDLAGSVELNDDSLWFEAERLHMPGSRVAGDGVVHFSDGGVALALDAQPAALADLRWLYPPLPSSGTGAMRFTMTLAGDTARYTVRDASISSGTADIAGDFGLVMVEDDLVFERTDLQFNSLGTRLIEQIVPGLEIPRRGMLTGRAALDGSLAAASIDADITFDDEIAGRSRVVANGMAGIVDGGMVADDLRLAFSPLQVALLRSALPELPVAGVVTGTATLDGSSAGRLAANMNLAHSDRGALSRIAGTAAMRAGPPLRVEADARVTPLALATIGRFAPDAGLRGQVTGRVQVRGPLSALAFSTALTTGGGGQVMAAGQLDMDGTPLGYDVKVNVVAFNAADILPAPVTSVTGEVAALGSGFDPATMRVALAADLQGSEVSEYTVDSLLVRATIVNGIATLDTMRAHGPGALAAAGGTIGLTADRRGELAYQVTIDSLSAFAGMLGGDDTTMLAVRPALAARRIAAARADSARRAQAAIIERLATGAVREQPVPVDTTTGIRRDSLAGSLYAAGVLSGNITRLDIGGRAAAEGVVARGSSVSVARLEYSARNLLTPSPAYEATAKLEAVVAAGFALDSVSAQVAHSAGGGTVAAAINQNDDTDYRLRAGYRLALDDQELRVDEMAMRFDSTTWRTAQPGVIRWGGGNVAVDHIDLRSDSSGRIFVNGIIPSEGPADLEILVRDFEIENVTSLLQSDIDAEGHISIAATLTGTAQSPRIQGAAAVADPTLRNETVPGLRAAFEYADETLVANAEALSPFNGRIIMTAEGVLPVNLALSTEAPRLPDRPLSLEVAADSLPLNLLPLLTSAISDADGAATANLAVTGTVSRPEVEGNVTVDNGRLRLTTTGMILSDLLARVRITRDTVVVDSLVAYSGGRIAMSGGIGIDTISRPAFDLFLRADGARVLANEIGELFADARLAMRGPFDAVYVNGTANIRSGVIYIPEPTDKEVISVGDPRIYNVVDSTVQNEVDLVPTPSPLLSNLRVDINVDVQRDTWVRSREANVELFTPPETGPLEFSLDQSQQRLVLNGVVATDRGEYTFLSKRFELRQGAVTFIGTPDLNPLLQLTGEYEVQLAAQPAFNIQVLIGGTLADPRITLETDAQPPLSQSDLISFLAFGRRSTSLLQFGGSALSAGGSSSGGLVGAGAAAATQRLGAVGLDILVNQVEGEATRSLGVDVFNITPAPVDLEAVVFGGTPNIGGFLRGTEVEAGKYLNTQTFASVTVRPSLLAPVEGDRFIPGVRLEHRFGTGWTLETSFDGRYVLGSPNLDPTAADRSPTGVFGLFLIREWRW